MQTARIMFKKMSAEAQIPCAARDGDIGLDVFALQDTYLETGKVVPVKTGIQLADANFTSPVFIKIEGRSGLAKKGIIPVGGIIDANYRGEIIVMLAALCDFSCSGEGYKINAGERIAQLIVYPACTQGVNLEVLESSEVKDTVRGDKGFGSSGK